MASSSDPSSLVELLRQPELRRLLKRLVARVHQGRDLSGMLRLTVTSEQERNALSRLQGTPFRGRKSIAIELDVLAQFATCDGHFPSLTALVEAAHGKAITANRAAHLDRANEWRQLWRDQLQDGNYSPSVTAWLTRPRVQAWIRRSAQSDLRKTKPLLHSLRCLLRCLPLESPTLLAQFAAETTGSSHALDSDTPLGRVTLRALAVQLDRPQPGSAADVRALWSLAGLVRDELSTTVLALNLPARPGTSLGDILIRLHQEGQPARLTFRQLQEACQFDPSPCREIFVCENPAVMAAAADRWRARAKPLVCVEGQPSLAAQALLELLVRQGFVLRYHGDFDWGGIRIAAGIWNKFSFQPWRFECADYLAAPLGRTLQGVFAEAPWDPTLSSAMRQHCTAVHEEAVMEQLLRDLSGNQNAPKLSHDSSSP
jgi:uncharacterized protein (TIGR02679 family)